MDDTIIERKKTDAGLFEVIPKKSSTIEIESSQKNEDTNGELKITDDEKRYCFFKYYFEAEEFKKRKSGEESSDFRKAIVKTISKIRNVSQTVNDLERGLFNKFLLSQKHVGETAFLQMLRDALKARGFKCFYINFYPHKDENSESNFNKLKLLIIEGDYSFVRVNDFFNELLRANQPTGLSETNFSQQRSILFIDNIDLAFCKLYMQDSIPINKIKDFRNSFIRFVREVNSNSEQYLKTCVVSLRKRKTDNLENTEDCFNREERISLRGEWENSEPYYAGLFFAELLVAIESNHEFDIDGEPINITHNQYKALRPKCYKTAGEHTIYCKFSLSQEDLNRIFKNNETSVTDEFFKGKFNKIIQWFDGNPYFIVRPIIEALKDINGEDKECKIDKNIKKYFRKIWKRPEVANNEPKFSNFLETLPLYLFCDISTSQFENIYSDAVKLLEEIIKKAKKNKDTNIYPIEIAKSLGFYEIYDKSIIKSIFETLEDNRAIICKDEYKKVDFDLNNDILDYYKNAFRIHPFLHYVFSDINGLYFKKY